MQKRILSVFLCVLLVLSFAACGTAPEVPSDTSGSSSVTAGNDTSDSVTSDGSGLVSDSAVSDTSSGTDSITDSVTDDPSSATTDSDPGMSDETGGDLDLAPGEDPGMGDYTDSSGEFSDYSSDDFYDSDTGTGILGSEDYTDTSGDYTDDPFGSDTSGNSGTQEDSESETVDITAGRKFLATDITNYGIVVYDLDACNGDYRKLTEDNVSVFWEWTYSGDPNSRLNGPGLGIDSAKLRYSAYYKKDVVIACSSSGWAGIIDYKECTLLWESNASDLSNAHSIEMLPNGDVVVAVSQQRTNGKPGLIYFSLSSGSKMPTHTIVCNSSHGVSWDPTNNCLWVLDSTEVYAVTVQNPGPNGKLQRVSGSSVGGFGSGHAFSPVAGSPGKYWIGAGSRVYQFDTKTKTLTKASDALQQNHVKGIASFADGTVVFTAYNMGGNPTQGWSSDGFRIVTKDGTSTTVAFSTNHREFYKVQPFTRDYQ